jgi:hypothetical protein
LLNVNFLHNIESGDAFKVSRVFENFQGASENRWKKGWDFGLNFVGDC